MRETVENAARGIFEFRQRRLYISAAKIELSLRKNEVREGSFSVTAKDGLPVRAYVYSTSLRMTLSVREFESKRQEIGYRFDSAGMDEGEIHNGEIHIVASGGEYRIPWSASVSYPVFQSSQGPVRNLFHFTNLAKSCWQEAVDLFYTPGFLGIFTGNDRQFLDCCRGMTAGTDRSQCLEEFLISIRKKEPVRYQAETEEIYIEKAEEGEKQDIILTKSGWGYAWLKAEAIGDFLLPCADSLSPEDFSENLLHFRYGIDVSKLHAGKNYGALCFSNLYQSLTVRVTVRADILPEGLKQKRRAVQELAADLTRLYADFRTRKITLAKWTRQSLALSEEWTQKEDDNPLPRLIQAQLLLAEQKKNEAGWILEHTGKEMRIAGQKPPLYAYYLYLTTLNRMDEEYTDQVTGKIREIYGECPRFSILWMLFYLDEELNFNLTRKFSLLEEQFCSGCRSVLLYTEAYALISREPAILTKLGRFEIQALYWSARRGLADRGVIRQTLTLCGALKEYRPLLVRLLIEYHGYAPEEELIHAICTLLIRGNRTDPASFPWYGLGVEYGLRITRLYEYYMMSAPLDREEPLPKTVLMYFAYASRLDYVRNAFLYASVLKHSEEYPVIAGSYERHILEFVTEQVKKRRVNKDLAFLYGKALLSRSLSEETAAGLSELLTTAYIPVADGRVKEIAVVHEQLKGEEVFPVREGGAYVRLYGGNYRLFALFDEGKRLHASISLKPEALFEDEAFIRSLLSGVKRNEGLSLRMCLAGGTYAALNTGNAACFHELFQSERVQIQYRNEIWEYLIRFYYDTDRMDEADLLLAAADPASMNAAQRAELVEYMVVRGMAGEAYDCILKYGMNRISPKVLVRICSRVLKKRGREPDRQLLLVCYDVFSRGKYDEEMLSYLGGCYEGMTRELKEIWKASAAFGLDTPSLSERLIVQMLFTREFVAEKEDIFEAYMRGLPDERVEMAYLANEAYGYFVLDEAADSRFFALLLGEHKRGVRLNDACKLALLKYNTDRKQEREEEKELLVSFIEELLRKNIYFPFFQEYRESIPRLSAYRDKTIVEYRAMPHSRVTIHYILENGEKGDERFAQEEMRNMFAGIFVKEFILFFGEELQYYITEETDGEERLTQSCVVSNNDMAQEGPGDRYDLLNDLSMSQTLKDEESLMKLMEKYALFDDLASLAFGILKEGRDRKAPPDGGNEK